MWAIKKDNSKDESALVNYIQMEKIDLKKKPRQNEALIY